MYSVSFNRKEVCKLPLEDFLVLKQIAVFWGLSWDDTKNELIGRLSDHTIRIIGLNRKELNRLDRSLEHTQAILKTHPCHADLTLSIFKETEPELTIKIESNNKVYKFETANKPYQSVSDMIYKRFEPNISTEAKIYWNPVNCMDITEWLAYLILQSNETTDILQDVPSKTYEKLLRNILVPINPFLSSYQLKHYWPEIPTSSNLNELQSREPINPFKGKNSVPSTQINPFKEKPKTSSTTINPFKQKADGKKKNGINPFFKN
ncbi:hypothetical protein ACJROX_10760 [Pseudalkalibacillus sp. A8]|uniref:hypothetical protein n=1 Tax=Pseudalkalibacillus sp. A8 TaxID=3382641 RepID=UPI0038B64F14